MINEMTLNRPGVLAEEKIRLASRWISIGLVVTLVFEGIIRKLLPPLGTIVFLLKDLLCLGGLVLVGRLRFPDLIGRLVYSWKILLFLFLPLLLLTAFSDVILAIFALKQYLLYPIAAILISVAFSGKEINSLAVFLFFCSLLLVPTTIVSVLQNSLSASHWLNQSVGGDSLEGFSAGGYVRVSSTFSFTAQYSWFLNAESAILVASYFIRPEFGRRVVQKFLPLIYLSLVFMLIASAFLTGGRTAVLGTGGTLLLGCVLIGIRHPGWLIVRGVPIIAFLLILVLLLRQQKPEFFAAYDERSAGYNGRSGGQEIQSRIFYGFITWTNWFWDQDSRAVFFGNGLGIMSNGSSQLSSYAADVRSRVAWTEGDVETTFWEGGIYLALIWYGFRAWIIIFCIRRWLAMRNDRLVSACALPVSYISIQGVISQFGIQPPLALWWWLAIGIVVLLSRYDRLYACGSLHDHSNNHEA